MMWLTTYLTGSDSKSVRVTSDSWPISTSPASKGSCTGCAGSSGAISCSSIFVVAGSIFRRRRRRSRARTRQTATARTTTRVASDARQPAVMNRPPAFSQSPTDASTLQHAPRYVIRDAKSTSLSVTHTLLLDTAVSCWQILSGLL